ncbi:transcription factor ATOH8 [Anthonomus grandis grandis]|uniref:transcription factor ATOH8 n=1 Tax=Anthonomus grandis grandis TaxID=2921223 RepID=UPI0021658F52|nr:transcription factor ATOH8 [Anthonomus grandis grandis]
MFSDMTHGNNTRLSFPSESNMSMSIHEDTGFCSGEDYMEHELHSPTDTSEDSVEVKVSTISYNGKKRKLTNAHGEQSRTTTTTFSGPLKKRMCQKMKAEADITIQSSTPLGKTPFRPWSPPKVPEDNLPRFVVPSPLPKPSAESRPFAYFRPPSPVVNQSEPVSLVIKREKNLDDDASDVRVPVHPQITKLSAAETERMILKTNERFPSLTAETAQIKQKTEQKREQRNYKNMTRERRIEANARERTRVHTISAAFDTLRKAVPSYSHNQKLSKLSVLRIACSYIMTLSSLVQEEESGSAEANTSEYVDMVSKTIQREGKLRKKKDDND